MIHGIDNVSIVVRDLESAVKWYKDILGLKHKFTEESIQWAEMDSGGQTSLALKTHGTASVCFIVTDLKEEMKRLKKKGIKFDKVFELPDGSGNVTNFKDPWGNRIDFYEPPRKT